MHARETADRLIRSVYYEESKQKHIIHNPIGLVRRQAGDQANGKLIKQGEAISR